MSCPQNVCPVTGMSQRIDEISITNCIARVLCVLFVIISYIKGKGVRVEI